MNGLGSMSRRLMCTLVLLAWVSVSQSALAEDHIPWLYDLEKAKQQAAAEDKLVMLHFSAAWCAPCKEIERFVFVNPMAIRAISSQIVPVKIDVDAQSHIADEYDVSAVPYDVLITPAGHVVSERTSPRSSDGYLQMIESANEIATNLSPEVIARTREIKDAMRQARRQQQVADNAAKSFGAVDEADTNQFTPHPPAHPGSRQPEFDGPAAWSAPQAEEIVVKPPADFKHEHRASQFIPPDGVQPPATFKTDGEAIVMNEFAAVKKDAATITNQFANNAATAARDLTGSATDFMAEGQRMAQGVSEDTQSFRATARTMQQSIAEDTRSFGGAAQNMTQNMAQDLAADANGFQAAASAAVDSAQQTAGQTLDQARQQIVRPMEVAGASQRPKMGLDGYCGVSLIDGQKWVKGDSRWGCIHRGRLYLFASEDFRNRFQATPDMYSPLLGGADPVEYQASGKLVDGERKHGVFYGDDDIPPVIVLFSNQANRDRFEAEPGAYLRTVRQAMMRLDGERLLR